MEWIFLPVLTPDLTPPAQTSCVSLMPCGVVRGHGKKTSFRSFGPWFSWFISWPRRPSLRRLATGTVVSMGGGGLGTGGRIGNYRLAASRASSGRRPPWPRPARCRSCCCPFSAGGKTALSERALAGAGAGAGKGGDSYRARQLLLCRLASLVALVAAGHFDYEKWTRSSAGCRSSGREVRA